MASHGYHVHFHMMIKDSDVCASDNNNNEQLLLYHSEPDSGLSGLLEFPD